MRGDLSSYEASYCKKLYFMLKEIITKEKASGLLLSGGLDSSIIASFQKPEYTFTVTLDGSNASDSEYAQLIANQFGAKHITIKITTDELLKIEEKIIELFRTFDPIFIRNASVIFAAVQKAKELGVVNLLTGDGGDELFAGYNYLKRYFNDIKKLEEEVKRLVGIMHFPSVTIGNFFNVKITSPYLDEKFIKFAMTFTVFIFAFKEQYIFFTPFFIKPMNLSIFVRNNLREFTRREIDFFFSFFEILIKMTFSMHFAIGKILNGSSMTFVMIKSNGH